MELLCFSINSLYLDKGWTVEADIMELPKRQCMGNSNFNSTYLQKAMINVWHRLIRHNFYCRSINYHCLSHKHHACMNSTKLCTHSHTHTCIYINRSRNRNNPANLTPFHLSSLFQTVANTVWKFTILAHSTPELLDMGQREMWGGEGACVWSRDKWWEMNNVNRLHFVHQGNSHIVQQLRSAYETSLRL